MKVLVTGRSGSGGQVRLRANSAAFNVFVVNLASSYTSGSTSGTDYFYNGGVTANQVFVLEAQIGTGSHPPKFWTQGSNQDGTLRYGAAEMTTNQAITSFSVYKEGGGNFSDGKMIILGSD